MKKHLLTKDQIHSIADQFAKKDREPYGTSEYAQMVGGYLKIYNATREELEKYNATVDN